MANLAATIKEEIQRLARKEIKAQTGSTMSFGDFGLKAMEDAWLTARQIEASRIAMTRFIKRGGKIWIRVFPDKPITKKPTEVRMGKGKGAPEAWVAVVKPGRIIYEINGVDAELAKGAPVGIFPEGGITRDGEIQRFRPGIEQILERRPVPAPRPVTRGRWPASTAGPTNCHRSPGYSTSTPARRRYCATSSG